MGQVPGLPGLGAHPTGAQATAKLLPFSSALSRLLPAVLHAPSSAPPFPIPSESYAGHYVPAVASRIYHATKSGEAQPPINLQARLPSIMFAWRLQLPEHAAIRLASARRCC